jgi:hypothetical protein
MEETMKRYAMFFAVALLVAGNMTDLQKKVSNGLLGKRKKYERP